MKFINQQQMKMMAPLLVALLMSACRNDGNSLLTQQQIKGEGEGSVCSTYRACDSDGDGISDQQEIDNGTNPGDPNDPVQGGNLDSDGDGIRNGQET
ncbi:thrombospondin type 3 repeat-containing protein, partial [Vibrio pacinii]